MQRYQLRVGSKDEHTYSATEDAHLYNPKSLDYVLHRPLGLKLSFCSAAISLGAGFFVISHVTTLHNLQLLWNDKFFAAETRSQGW